MNNLITLHMEFNLRKCFLYERGESNYSIFPLLQIYIGTGSALLAVSVLVVIVVFIIRNFRRKLARQTTETQFASNGSRRPLLQTTNQSYQHTRVAARDSMPLRAHNVVENPHYGQKNLRLKNETCKFTLYTAITLISM